MTGWRGSPFVAGLVIALFIIVQIGLPVSRMGSEERARFGWQMYSTATPIPDLFVITEDGGEMEIEIDDYVAHHRVELDILTRLPPHLCSVIEGAQRVEWEGGSHQC